MIDSNYGKIITHRTEFVNYNQKNTNFTKKNKKKEQSKDTKENFDKIFKQECDKLG